MPDQKNLILAIVLSLLIIFTFSALYGPMGPPPQEEQQATQEAGTGTGEPLTGIDIPGEPATPTLSRDEALDLVQDAMLGFVRRYGGRPPEEWAPLFHRVLQNRLTDWHRRRRFRSGIIRFFSRDEEGQEVELQQTPSPEQDPARRQLDCDRAVRRLEVVDIDPVGRDVAVALQAVQEIEDTPVLARTGRADDKQVVSALIDRCCELDGAQCPVLAGQPRQFADFRGRREGKARGVAAPAKARSGWRYSPESR